MNTPKLLSLLSSPVGKTDTVRTNSASGSAHGLEFSQLLGERRSQQAAVRDSNAVRNSDPVRNEAGGRAADRNSVAERQAAARSETPSASQPAARNEDRNTSAVRSDSSSTNRAENSRTTSANRDGGTTSENTGASTPAAGTNAGTSADSGQPIAEEDASAGVSEIDVVAAVDTPTNPTDAAMAEDAADAGLVVLAAGAAISPDVETVVATNAGTTRVAAGAADAALPFQRPVPNTLQQSDPATAAAIAEMQIDTDGDGVAKPVTGPAIQAAILPTAGAPTRPAPNTLTLTPAAAQFTAVSPAAQAELPIAAPTLQTAAPAALYQAAPELPLSNIAMQLSTDVAGSAAALSLQDFTAMVADARATSGTSLQPTAPASLSAPAINVLGMMPAGLLPGQGFGLAPTTATGGINAPLNSPQWPTELGRQFISIAQSGNGLGQVAELRLDPPDLGPLRITINLNDNVAHAVFSSPHAAVRQTVENAIPQLQQMLEQAGISLGQANVNDQDQAGQAFQEQHGQGRRSANAGSDTGVSTAGRDGTPAERARPADPSALVDTFA